MIKAILGYDFSEYAEKAIKFTINNLSNRIHYLELIYVIGLNKLVILNSEEIYRFKAEIEKKLQEKVSEISKYITECKYTIAYGEDISDTIYKYAKENKFDLIIIGRRGLNKIEYALVGSVSGKLLKISDIPILIIESYKIYDS
ncbi:universal stress protein [Saccharolobus caldissimus]|uniref:UspA domain-containing protein n=1 Tax=Saccharolobus caldissimus TaxID=1702097 RepID=A0AAQ4CS74_9CREN|nr:universal stress protein [Saccharolobus caldissimus]BDB98655.1 hypothetical protein SACC_16720 [Saccharolobus caldissimus]